MHPFSSIRLTDTVWCLCIQSVRRQQPPVFGGSMSLCIREEENDDAAAHARALKDTVAAFNRLSERARSSFCFSFIGLQQAFCLSVCLSEYFFSVRINSTTMWKEDNIFKSTKHVVVHFYHFPTSTRSSRPRSIDPSHNNIEISRSATTKFVSRKKILLPI